MALVALPKVHNYTYSIHPLAESSPHAARVDAATRIAAELRVVAGEGGQVHG